MLKLKKIREKKMAETTIKVVKENFSDFKDKISNLSNISNNLKIRFENDKILVYAAKNVETAIQAFKSYTLELSDYFECDNTGIYELVITESAKFAKNISLFNNDKDIKLDITYKKTSDINHIRSACFSNGKIKANVIGGELHAMMATNISKLSNSFNLDNSLWGFNISKEDFKNIKKMCAINSEETVVNVSVENGIVTLNELTKWEYVVDEISHKNDNVVLIKKYLSFVTGNEDIEINVFEKFILVDDGISKLMLGIEQTFE